ncbi:hypothetical protein Dimus_022489 [Dionaea muscipula]
MPAMVVGDGSASWLAAKGSWRQPDLAWWSIGLEADGEVVRRNASMKLYMGTAGHLAETLASKREHEYMGIPWSEQLMGMRPSRCLLA